jgi:protein pelota
MGLRWIIRAPAPLNILKIDRKIGLVILVPQSVEDLWDLYNVIEAEDLVAAPTYRVVKVEDTSGGDKVRVPTYLKIKVSDTELDISSNTLKVRGIVMESPEQLEGVKGRHHSITVKPGTKITIQKDRWLRHQWRRLVVRRRRSRPLLIIAIESGNASIGIVRDFGVVSIKEVSVHIPGKVDPSSSSRERAVRTFLQNILEVVREAVKQLDYSLVIVGPGFMRGDFVDFLRTADKAISQRIAYVGSATSGTPAGIYESLRSGAVRNAVEKTRAIEESVLVEEVLARIGAGDKVAYGLQDVKIAAQLGGIDTLLVSEKLPMQLDAEGRAQLENLIKAVEEGKGNVLMISPRHEGGEKLERLGGICALLRYPLQLR